jgi:hypothetical protein
MRKFTAAGRGKIRRQEAKKEKVPLVGLFFVVNGKPCVEGIPWIEHRSLAAAPMASNTPITGGGCR